MNPKESIRKSFGTAFAMRRALGGNEKAFQAASSWPMPELVILRQRTSGSPQRSLGSRPIRSSSSPIGELSGIIESGVGEEQGRPLVEEALQAEAVDKPLDFARGHGFGLQIDKLDRLMRRFLKKLFLAAKPSRLCQFLIPKIWITAMLV